MRRQSAADKHLRTAGLGPAEAAAQYIHLSEGEVLGHRQLRGRLGKPMRAIRLEIPPTAACRPSQASTCAVHLEVF